jgi:hypothetical protein
VSESLSNAERPIRLGVSSCLLGKEVRFDGVRMLEIESGRDHTRTMERYSHVRRHAIGYLNGQVFLEPHPRELMLRNHV